MAQRNIVIPTSRTQRPLAGWTSEEIAKLDKYLMKEAAGDKISDEKWGNSLRRHSISSIKAKRRYRLKELQKAGVNCTSSSSSSSSTPPKSIEKQGEKTSAKAQRELFNTIFTQLNPPSSSQVSQQLNTGKIKVFFLNLKVY